MENGLYHTGQFARKASVSRRTLRYYDAVGVLSPSHYSESGYRLYTDKDLRTLQCVLALKFLGFSLEEVKQYLGRGPVQFTKALAQQKAMLLDRKRQIDTILKAIAHTESLLTTGQPGWEAIVGVIEGIQMEQKQNWVDKYFEPEQVQMLDKLNRDSYSEEAREKLKQRGPWTEADQERASQQWAHVYSESDRLAAAGADPAGEEGQAVAKLKSDLLMSFTQGDPQITEGLKKFWENMRALPADQQPLAKVMPPISPEGSAFLEQAMAIYKERSISNSSEDW